MSETGELPLLATRSASGVPRRKKNHAAPVISHTRPSSEVSWRMFVKDSPTNPTIATGPDGGHWRSHGDNATNTTAVVTSHPTYGAGIVNHHAPSRPSENPRSPPNGHGTRPSHAAAAQTTSAAATPSAGGIDRRANC